MTLKLITAKSQTLDGFEVEQLKYLNDNGALWPRVLDLPEYGINPWDDTHYLLMDCGCIFTFGADDFVFNWHQCKIHQVPETSTVP